MENSKERFERRLRVCEEAIAKCKIALNENDLVNGHYEAFNQLLLYQVDALYYIRELEAEIRANERYIKMLKEDRDEAWRFCKL